MNASAPSRLARAAPSRPARLAQSRPARLALVASLALASSPARADASAERVAQASSFFDAGAQAYEAGQYLVAAEAFQNAHALMPSPSLLFSAAQAYRRVYLAEASPDALRRAVALYRDYLRDEPKGKRREDAMQSLESLAPLEARLGASHPEAAALVGEGAPAAPNDAGSTRLLLSARGEGAEASVDGGPFVPVPAVVKVQPGPHGIRVRAPGYFEERVTIVAVASELSPLSLGLRPRPAKLVLLGTAGARVAVDGQVRAIVPTSAPIALEPGARFVTVTLAGHEPWSRVVDLRRDASTTLTVELPLTTQRIAAWSVLGAGAAAAVTSGVLAGLSLARQGEAVDLRAIGEAGTLTPTQRDAYNAALGARNDLAMAAAITGGASLFTLVTGAGLFAFDLPVAPLPSGDDASKEPRPRAELTVGLSSVGVQGRF